LTAAVYGVKKPGKQVRVSVRAKKLGKRHIAAKLYRKIKQNGKVVKTELIGSPRYKWEAEAPD
jgi:hypothetical protein